MLSGAAKSPFTGTSFRQWMAKQGVVDKDITDFELRYQWGAEVVIADYYKYLNSNRKGVLDDLRRIVDQEAKDLRDVQK